MRPIDSVPPGMALTNLYFAATPGTGGKYHNREPVPDQITVTIAYGGPDGSPYNSSYRLDTDLQRLGTFRRPAGNDDKALNRRQVEALEVIAGAVEQLSLT